MTYRFTITLISLILLAASGMAETPETSVSGYLTPDGRFDIEALRQVGFEGSIDLEGFDVALDLESGTPTLSPVRVTGAKADPDDQYWHDISVPDVGMNHWVQALAIYDGDLIAGGTFTTASGVAANYIARWDGSSWQPLGLGLNNWVFTLTVYDDELIAGGSFTTAGGVTANYIARWNGSD